VAREGGSRFYIYMLKGDGRGKGLIFFYKFIMEGGGVG